MIPAAPAANISDEADKLGFWAARQSFRRLGAAAAMASCFLPRRKREAVFAVCAFCAMIRDAISQVEEGSEPASGCGSGLDQRMALIAARLDDIDAGALDLPLASFRTSEQHVLHAFVRTVHRYEVPRRYLRELVEGCRADRLTRRYATWTALERHCRSTGGVIGMMIGSVLGLSHSDACIQLGCLGSAIRLTHILRDIGPDWQRGRLYLPLEDLVQFGCSEKDLGRGVLNDALVKLIKFQIARARELYRIGADGLVWIADDGPRLAACTVAVASMGILDALERRKHDVFSRPPALSTGQVLRRLPAAWRLARRRPGERPASRALGIRG